MQTCAPRGWFAREFRRVFHLARRPCPALSWVAETRPPSLGEGRKQRRGSMVRLVLGKRRGAVFPFVLHGADGEVAVARHRLRGVGSRHVADIGAIAVPARGGHGAGDRRVVRPAIIQPHGGACRAGRIVVQLPGAPKPQPRRQLRISFLFGRLDAARRARTGGLRAFNPAQDGQGFLSANMVP